MPGRPGSALVKLRFARDVRVMLEARTDHEGRSVTLERAGAAWEAGLVWAAFRWSPGDGPADLLIWWPGKPPDIRVTWREGATEPPPDDLPDPPAMEYLNSAGVSDVDLLSRDASARWAVRAFLDTLSAVGRPPGLTDIENDEQIRSVVRELRANHTRVTQQNVVAWAGTFTLSALRNYLRVHGRKWAEIIDT